MNAPSPVRITGPLYSQQVDDSLRASVRRIAGTNKPFATDFIVMGDYDDATSLPVRLEAVPDHESGTYQIDRLTLAPGDIVKKEKVASGLCFFDALHYCARFQTEELGKGKTPMSIPGPEFQSLPSYRKAAEKAGQALDLDGMPHPSLNGRILTEGFFDRQNLRTALTSKAVNENRVPKETYGVLSIVAPRVSNSRELAVGPHLTADAGEKIKMAAAFSLAIKSIKETLAYVDRCLDHHYTPAYANPATFISIQNFKPDLGSGARFTKLRDALNKLPESEEKTLCLEFAKAAQMTFWAGRAACVFEKQKDKPDPNFTKKGLAYIEQGVKIVGLDDIEAGALKQEFLACHLSTDGLSKQIMSAWWGKRRDGRVANEDTDRYEIELPGLYHRMKKRLNELHGVPN